MCGHECEIFTQVSLLTDLRKGIVVSRIIFRWNHNRPHIVDVMLDCTFSPIWIWNLCTFEERGQWKSNERDGWLVASHSYNLFNTVYCNGDIGKAVEDAKTID